MFEDSYNYQNDIPDNMECASPLKKRKNKK